jgi:hypothetical protein
VIGARQRAIVGAAILLLQAPHAWAQSAAPSSRVELGVGVSWIGGQPLGDTTANETTAAGSTRPLFTASSDLGAAAGFAGRAGVRLTRSLVAEAEGAYTKPQVRIALTADAESAADVTAVETVEQFSIGGGVLWYLPTRGLGRIAPFATAGGGYLRQLHEQGTLVETGSFYQIGGGASVLLITGRHFLTKGMGARVDVRAMARSKGIKFDGGSTWSPAAGVSAFLRF